MQNPLVNVHEPEQVGCTNPALAPKASAAGKAPAVVGEGAPANDHPAGNPAVEYVVVPTKSRDRRKPTVVSNGVGWAQGEVQVAGWGTSCGQLALVSPGLGAPLPQVTHWACSWPWQAKSSKRAVRRPRIRILLAVD